MRRKLLAGCAARLIFFVGIVGAVASGLKRRGKETTERPSKGMKLSRMEAQRRKTGVQENPIEPVGGLDSNSRRKVRSAAGRRAAESYKRRVERGKSDKIYVSVRPKGDFLEEIPPNMTRIKEPHRFETQDVGRKGHSMRVAGVTKDKDWADKTWVLSKEDFRVGKHGEIIPRNRRARELLSDLQRRHGAIIPVKGDTFRFEGAG